MKRFTKHLIALALCCLLLPTVQAAEQMTRGDLCTLLVEGLGMEGLYRNDLANPFVDVKAGDPNYEAILILKHLGIVNGDYMGYLYPNNTFTRVELAKILCAAGQGGAGTSVSNPPDISDSHWAITHVRSVLDSGVMVADENGNFRPNDYASASDICTDKLTPLQISDELVEFDLSDGSISIESNSFYYIYSQGETVVNSAGACIVTQSDISVPTSNRIITTAVDGSAKEVKLTIAGLNMSAALSPISLEKNARVTLALAGENTITCTGSSFSKEYAGVSVPNTAQLTIKGNGKLTAAGGNYGAGIGGNYYDVYGNMVANPEKSATGTIVIESGTIVAVGGTCAAGIGSGTADAGGTITINGGTVIATGGNSGYDWSTNWGAAGIGAGGGSDKAKGGLITINGGAVTANGGYGAAGIGGSDGGNGGKIIINGGTVTATGNCGGAGIGAGRAKYSVASGGSILINGGEVTAVGGGNGAAGIGGGARGDKEDCYSEGGTVYIGKATVSAAGDYYAIGGGELNNRTGCDEIMIDKSAVLNLTCTHDSGAYYQEKITISKQPLDSAAHDGNDAKFVVEATGHSGLSWQWQSNANGDWVDVAEETENVGYIFVTDETAGTPYRCKITNGWGNVVYSDAAVSYILAFSQQPADVNTDIADTAVLSVASTCSNVTYQWQRSYDDGATWQTVEGKISPTLVVITSLNENNAFYRCVITATNGDQLASDAARIAVNTDKPTYTVYYCLEKADGSGYSIQTQRVLEGTVGQTVTAQEMTFDGFAENVSAGMSTGVVVGDSSLILRRYYDRNTYAITFEMNGASPLPALEARYGTAVEAPVAPVRYGYTFDSWYADAELTEKYVFTTMPLNGATVYAKWISANEGRSDSEYHINGITLRSGSTNLPVGAIPEGSFYAEVSFTNRTSDHMDMLVLATYTAEGKLLDMYFLYTCPQKGQTAVMGVLLDHDKGQIGEVKAFILTGFNGTQPLANSVSVGK